MQDTTDIFIAETRAWVDRIVIGLNLCPFARAVQVRGQVRYVVSDATDADTLLQDLHREIDHLVASDPEELDTTLLIHPQVLDDFFAYNEFLGAADELLAQLGQEGVLQVASFHPQFQFADAQSDDVSNATNRSPYPTLHLLREDSVDRAVEAFPDARMIFGKNIRTMEALGAEGFAALQVQCRADAANAIE